MSQDQLFPHPRRIVTGHDTEGNSIVVKDSVIPCLPTPVKCNFAVLYETSQVSAGPQLSHRLASRHPTKSTSPKPGGKDDPEEK
jgi:hypothetical protein